MTPLFDFIFHSLAVRESKDWPRIPKLKPRTIFPFDLNSLTIFNARLIGIANPIPIEPCLLLLPVYINVFIPITSPFTLTNGPPLLPGFIAASV